MSARAIAAQCALLALAMAAVAGAGRSATPIFGFTATSLPAERRMESRFLRLPSERRLREYHRYLTARPHPAGSPRNRHLAEWIREHWQAWGLEDVHMVTHEVLLPSARDTVVERVRPTQWTASLREDPIESDPHTAQDAGPGYHAYSASGERTGALVYAGSGDPEQYDWLAAQGIDLEGRIALVRYSVPYSYRGYKAYTAQQRGLAGILIYSDPEDDGYGKGKVYPDGPWGPESHLQRGSISFDFLAPGDPLTPGWASVPGSRRLDARDAVTLPRILSVPLSHRDARVLLESIGGPETPASWSGGLPITYRAGGRDTVVRLRVEMHDAVRPIQTVVGRVRGRDFPDEEVIVGNHRDAWVFGGVDPSSGTAVLMELARSLGTLLRHGDRPRRTMVLASWDAEELALTSSTEWGEQFAGDLQRRAVAYLNVDSAVSGPRFSASAVPSLARLIAEAARDVRAPATRLSVARSAIEQHRRETGAQSSSSMTDLVNIRLGSGSDYAVFLHHLGIPVADVTFAGPYGVYHSIYDTYRWVERFGDPGFRYHAAMTRLWGLMALRLANADVLPFDYVAYADALATFVTEVSGRTTAVDGRGEPFARVTEAIQRFRDAASNVTRRISTGSTSLEQQHLLNAALMQVERAFLDHQGLAGRPWYRHVVFAPQYSYAAEVLPAAAEAIRAKDDERLAEACGRLARAIDRAATILSAWE